MHCLEGKDVKGNLEFCMLKGEPKPSYLEELWGKNPEAGN